MIREIESVKLGPLTFATLETGEVSVTIRPGVSGTVLLSRRKVTDLYELLTGFAQPPADPMPSRAELMRGF
jgi:hypothetical protein